MPDTDITELRVLLPGQHLYNIISLGDEFIWKANQETIFLRGIINSQVGVLEWPKRGQELIVLQFKDVLWLHDGQYWEVKAA